MFNLKKTVNSKLFFLLIGILLAISVSGIWAAWNSTYSTVVGGQQLTSGLWNTMTNNLNDVVAKLVELDGRVGTIESGGTGGAPCNWVGERGVYGNMGGCNDDFYITCDGTKITNTRWGC